MITVNGESGFLCIIRRWFWVREMEQASWTSLALWRVLPGDWWRTSTSPWPRRRQRFRTSWRFWTSTSSMMRGCSFLQTLMPTLVWVGVKARLSSATSLTTRTSWRSWSSMASIFQNLFKDGTFFGDATWPGNNANLSRWERRTWRRTRSSKRCTWFLVRTKKLHYNQIEGPLGVRPRVVAMLPMKTMRWRCTRMTLMPAVNGLLKMDTMRRKRPTAWIMIGNGASIRKLSTSRKTPTRRPLWMDLSLLGLKSMIRSTRHTWMPGRDFLIASFPEVSIR